MLHFSHHILYPSPSLSSSVFLCNIRWNAEVARQFVRNYQSESFHPKRFWPVSPGLHVCWDCVLLCAVSVSVECVSVECVFVSRVQEQLHSLTEPRIITLVIWMFLFDTAKHAHERAKTQTANAEWLWHLFFSFLFFASLFCHSHLCCPLLFFVFTLRHRTWQRQRILNCGERTPFSKTRLNLFLITNHKTTTQPDVMNTIQFNVI